MIKTKAKIIFFAESEPKTEPDADCHEAIIILAGQSRISDQNAKF